MAIAGGLTEEQLEKVLPNRAKKGGETKVVAEKETKEVVEGIEVTIASPAHLWGLGHITLKTDVRTLQEAAALVGEAQTFFQNLEKGYAERLEEVAEIQRRVSPAQLEMLENLAEKSGEELPDDIEEMSKTQAGLLIKEMLAKSGESERPRGRFGRKSTGRSFSRRSSKRPASRRYRDEGGDDEITPAQKRFLKLLGADEDEYKDLTKAEASKLIKELKEEADEEED